jgi:hypothetical protein
VVTAGSWEAKGRRGAKIQLGHCFLKQSVHSNNHVEMNVFRGHTDKWFYINSYIFILISIHK